MPQPIDLTSPGPRISDRRHHAVLAEACELLRLALPLAATQLAQMVILATDTLMLGHYSNTALAAAALGNTVFFLAWLLGSGPAMAVSPVIAHIQGETGAIAAKNTASGEALPALTPGTRRPRDRRKVRASVRMGLWSALMASVPLFVLLTFARPILLFLDQEPSLAAGAGRFVSALAFGLPFALVFQVLRSFSTALSRAVPPMVVMGLAILFNALGDYALIFGHFGLPRLGLLGSGIASASSNVFSCVTMMAVVFAVPGLRRYRILRRLARPDWKRLAELFHLGIPISITMVFEVALFNAATLAMGVFGIAPLAAHQVAITIPSLTFMVPLGIGLAATVRVGLAAGAGDRLAARRAGFTAMGVATCFMLVTAMILALLPHAIATLWLPDTPGNRDTVALAVGFLHIAAAFQLFDGLQVTAAMSLRGLKDAHMPMWLAGISYWLVGAPVCLFLGFGLGLKGTGIWLGLAFALAAAAATLGARFWILSKRPIPVGA